MKPIVKVPSFQTSDGQLHSDCLIACRHQARIEIQGMIQSRALIASASGAPMTPAQTADFIVTHRANILALLRELADKERRAEASAKAQATISKK